MQEFREFQSTRPRGARRRGQKERQGCGHISIHAPAWDATAKYSVVFSCGHISIHAPAWGATHLHRLFRRRSRNFNPRARVGRDGRDSLLPSACKISIHAPAWGATLSHSCHGLHRHISIHAPAWGATCFFLISGTIEVISIHAPAWGATRGRPGTAGVVPDFNPRARVGRDLSLSMGNDSLIISIHAPAWGATNLAITIDTIRYISIHAPAWGATVAVHDV